MYEDHLAASETGIIDVDVKVSGENSLDGGGELLGVSVQFAVGTEDTAWVSIDGNGDISPAFGGTGVADREIQPYIQQAVNIWSTITGNESDCTLTRQITPQQSL